MCYCGKSKHWQEFYGCMLRGWILFSWLSASFIWWFPLWWSTCNSRDLKLHIFRRRRRVIPWMDITIHVDVATAAVLLSHHNKPIITIGATIENVPTASCTSDGEKFSLGWRVHQMNTVFRTVQWRFSVVDWRASDDGMTFKTSIYLMNDFPSSCNGHANTHGFVCHPGKSVEMIPPNYVHVQSNASVVTPWWFPCVVVVLEMCNLRSLISIADTNPQSDTNDGNDWRTAGR